MLKIDRAGESSLQRWRDIQILEPPDPTDINQRNNVFKNDFYISRVRLIKIGLLLQNMVCK